MFQGVRTFVLCIALLAAGIPIWRVSAQVTDRSASRSASKPAPSATQESAVLYDRFCLACHGSHGDGQGPAAPWLWPQPRDFTRGEYKWRTTPSGAPPTDEDLAAAIRHGVPGTSMHAFGVALSTEQIQALVARIKAFAPQSFEQRARPLTVGTPPVVTPDLVARGKTLYGQLGCVSCHGAEAKGNGPAAAGLRTMDNLPSPPYDLTALPLRRPRAPEASTLAAIYTSLVTGLSGTPMPAYAGAVPEPDLWAVAAYVDSLRYRPGSGTRQPEPTAVHPLAAQMDKGERQVKAGFWPGHGMPEESAVFGKAIALQGPAPEALAPAQASLDARQCARCHAKQVREWRDSLHASAASPGLLGDLHAVPAATVESCQRCHAPLAEQMPVLRPGHRGGDDDSRVYTSNPRFDEDLRHQGINCASCHVRQWQRLGPPRLPGSGLLGLSSYPLVETAIYERADFCLGCHQLPPRGALNGKPLLNTYREWLEGPYMRRGVQCQHCHMPNREHTWKGVHDPDTFRQGIAVTSRIGRSPKTGAVSVRARITNVGAGHYLPTTPTPAAWLSIELVDRAGKRIPGAHAEKRIGRHLVFDKRFREIEDTRIPPGQSLELAAAWKGRSVARAVAARIRVRVAPDDYYEALYRRRLASKRPPEVRALFEQALRRAEASHYVAYDELVELEPQPAAGAQPRP